jgi:hypothetical protein
MSTANKTEAAKPIPVQIVPVEPAQVEIRTTAVTFNTSAAPQNILGISTKRVNAVINIIGVNPGTNSCYLCTSYADAQSLVLAQAAGSGQTAGSILINGTFELRGTGEFFIVSPQGTCQVGIIAEYEA